MSLALDRKPVVDVSPLPEQVEELNPDLFAFAGIQESLGVPNHKKSVTSPRQENVQSLRMGHESNVARDIASGQCDEDYFALFPLIVVYVRWELSAACAIMWPFSTVK